MENQYNEVMENQYYIPETPFIVKMMTVFMGMLFLHHIFQEKTLFSLPDSMKRLLIQQINQYFYKEAVIEDEPEIESNEKESIQPIALLYEDKYVEEFKRLNDELIFSQEDMQEEEDEKGRIIQIMEKTKEEIKQKITILENEDNSSEEITLLKELYLKPTEEEKINIDARIWTLNKRLSMLKNNIIMEKTPLGNVVMFYNHTRTSFEYYSDSTIPYRYLETVARKYVVTYQCKCIYVDMMQQIKEAQEKLDEKKRKDVEQLEKEKELRASNNSIEPLPKKNIFAKFKSYNKDTSINVGSVPVDRKSSAKQTKPQEEKVVKENANRYSYEGKLVNFSFLKKTDRRVVDKRFAVSFSEFKKMQKL